ncbi:tetratricopeptide repeat protein [Actinoplanes sp. NBC_00393]|uniref:tetratricopeptide repeat protein n=1 Tax=Actinoplanes sp. NBC_00393 TaxID=2975953 RepID=UPI002E1FC88C
MTSGRGPGLADPGDRDDDEAGRRKPDEHEPSILEFDVSGRSRSPDGTDPAAKAGRLVQRAIRMCESGDYQGAIGLLDIAIGLDPTVAGPWLWKGFCLMSAGNAPAAVAALERARSRVRGAEALAKVERDLATLQRRLTDQPIGQARLRLRAGEADAALKLLDACAPTLSGDESFEARRVYARERTHHPEPGGPTELTHATLQTVLAWLSREEMTHGRKALESGDYTAAAAHLGRARQRDPRHTEAIIEEANALLHIAESIMLTALPEWEKWLAQIRRTARFLRRADELAEQAATNTALADQVTAVRRRIAASTRTNDEWNARVTKVVKVHKCVSEFNRLVNHLNRNRGNPTAIMAVITSFPPVEVKAHRLLNAYGPDDPDVGPALADLVKKVKSLRRSIR